MPRTNRIYSKTNVYHIIVRGNNKQRIFLNTRDFENFIKILKKYKEKYNYSIYCYILMINHVHMIIDAKNEDISTIMHSINQAYSSFFNKKYKKCGHVFQDRFKSKAVENSNYLLNLQRYIHLNCVKAGIAKINEYRWSSYNEFINKNKICDTTIILKLFGNDKKEAIKNFIIFNNKGNFEHDEQNVSEFEIKVKLTDEEVIDIIENIFKIKREEIKKYNKNKELLCKCIKIKGANKTQIARIFGIDKRKLDKIFIN